MRPSAQASSADSKTTGVDRPCASIRGSGPTRLAKTPSAGFGDDVNERHPSGYSSTERKYLSIHTPRN